jgi:hypothetical protein
VFIHEPSLIVPSVRDLWMDACWNFLLQLSTTSIRRTQCPCLTCPMEFLTLLGHRLRLRVERHHTRACSHLLS